MTPGQRFVRIYRCLRCDGEINLQGFCGYTCQYDQLRLAERPQETIVVEVYSVVTELAARGPYLGTSPPTNAPSASSISTKVEIPTSGAGNSTVDGNITAVQE